MNLISLGLWLLCTKLAAGRMNWRIFFLNIGKLLELVDGTKLAAGRMNWRMFFLNVGKLLELVDGKKEFLKNLWFTLRIRMMRTVFVVYGTFLTRFKLERYSEYLL